MAEVAIEQPEEQGAQGPAPATPEKAEALEELIDDDAGLDENSLEPPSNTVPTGSASAATAPLAAPRTCAVSAKRIQVPRDPPIARHLAEQK